jgi:hypothetical protein
MYNGIVWAENRITGERFAQDHLKGQWLIMNSERLVSGHGMGVRTESNLVIVDDNPLSEWEHDQLWSFMKLRERASA